MNRILKRIADAGAPKYKKAAQNDYSKLTKNLISFMDIYKDKYIDLYKQTHDPSALEEELSLDVKEAIISGDGQIFSDYIYGGDLASHMYDEIEDNDKDPNDDNVLDEHVRKVLKPWTNLEEYIAENGPSADSDKNIHNAVEEFIEDNF